MPFFSGFLVQRKPDLEGREMMGSKGRSEIGWAAKRQGQSPGPRCPPMYFRLPPSLSPWVGGGGGVGAGALDNLQSIAR